MENSEKTNEVLKDLIQINNDRADGFAKASADLDEPNLDLRLTFDKFAAQSREFVAELNSELDADETKEDDGNTLLGTLHRAWIDIKATFGGSDRHSILAECERGEDAIKKAYRDALQENQIRDSLRNILQEQQVQINRSHDTIRALRDSSKSVD